MSGRENSVAPLISSREGEAMRTSDVARLRLQLDEAEVSSLASVLVDLAEQVRASLVDNLVGVYLKGSFALGSGDMHSDVDFLVATHRRLGAAEEGVVRGLHRRLPEREEHWARVLEGSYASVGDLRQRADPSVPWLYVDNGNCEMEWSTHDNTEVFRWVLRNRAVAITGPHAATLIDDVPPLALRREAADLAAKRMQDIAEDPDYLRNAWGQPHEVLTCCRLLFTAVRAEAGGKIDAGLWCKGVVPEEWHALIDEAIAARPNPWRRVHELADPALAGRTWEFVSFMTPLVVRAATATDQQLGPGG